MSNQESWPLIAEVLQTGPADGHQIFERAQTGNVWEVLYLASRASSFAVAWREAFGRQRLSHHGPKSVLELAVRLLSAKADVLEPGPDSAVAVFAIKLLANCCADNDLNRRTVIHAGGLLPLIKLLTEGADPNLLVPTIYNICADFEDPAEEIKSNTADTEQQVVVSLAEERLARTDVPSNSIYAGVIAFCDHKLVRSCTDDIKEYLAELVEMSARPAAAAHQGFTDPRDGDFAFPLQRLLARDGGQLLADYSLKCKLNVIRSLIAVTASAAARSFLAASGMVFHLASAADCENTSPDYYGDDETELAQDLETLNSLQTAVLKLLYEICQMPEISDPPKYGIARHCLFNLREWFLATDFGKASAYIMLYSFIDGDARAHLLVQEGVIQPLLETLSKQSNKSVLHPALGVATKLAVTWSIRKELHEKSAMQTVQRLLVGADFGYEIPLNAITFYELMIKGHPEHVVTLALTRNAVLGASHSTTVLDNTLTLFDKGHEAICMEVGRLLIELCATMAEPTTAANRKDQLTLDAVVNATDKQAWSRVLVYMATKAQAVDIAVAQRVWFALGLLSTTAAGREIVLLSLQDVDLQQKMDEVESQVETWPAGNIKYMKYNLQSTQATSQLTASMDQMSIG